ncbi:hypothetical protein WD019_02955 [Fictibacillus sp. Mic-4]|uniref:hypothetical protein n=1 Tax=Fictibacillus sp. Mic-4 TaxID=3132826 RepID=UPI003CF61076
MSIGQALKEGLHYQKMKQQELAKATHYSVKSVSAWTNESRPIPEDMRSVVSQIVDYPDLYLEQWLEATGGVGLPVLDGDFVDRHPAAMKELVTRETQMALDRLGQASFTKPIHIQTKEEREEMKTVIKQLLDAACTIINLISILCREYRFSFREICQSWCVSLVARRMIKKRKGWTSYGN